MARQFFCPKCGADITESVEFDDPSVGIFGGYFCETCNEGFPFEDDEPDYDEAEYYD